MKKVAKAIRALIYIYIYIEREREREDMDIHHAVW
jgi:hypothetical protein